MSLSLSCTIRGWVDWIPVKEADFCIILCTPFTLNYLLAVWSDTFRILLSPFSELGGCQVFQGRVYPAVVVAVERSPYRLIGLSDVYKLMRPDVLLEHLVERLDVLVLLRRVDVDVFESDSQRGPR